MVGQFNLNYMTVAGNARAKSRTFETLSVPMGIMDISQYGVLKEGTKIENSKTESESLAIRFSIFKPAEEAPEMGVFKMSITNTKMKGPYFFFLKQQDLSMFTYDRMVKEKLQTCNARWKVKDYGSDRNMASTKRFGVNLFFPIEEIDKAFQALRNWKPERVLWVEDIGENKLRELNIRVPRIHLKHKTGTEVKFDWDTNKVVDAMME